MRLMSVMKLVFLLSVWTCLSTPLNSHERKARILANLKPRTHYYFGSPIETLKIVQDFLPEDPVIIDCGAYDGKESVIMATTWPKGTIHSFEPVDSIYHRLVETTLGCENIKTYNFALGKDCNRAAMYLSKFDETSDSISMSSSLMRPKEHLKYSDVVFEGEQIVQVTTMDAWAKAANVDHVDMLWLDMQGGELDALQASPVILSTVSVIISEVEFVEAYEGQPLFQEIKEWLEDQGFIFVGSNFNIPPHPTRWAGDGLFVRKEIFTESKKPSKRTQKKPKISKRGRRN